MISFSPDNPLDVTILKALADAQPNFALEQFAHVLEQWRKAGATVFLGAWEDAYRHYEGAAQDEPSRHVFAIQLAFVMCGIPIINPVAAPKIRDFDEGGVGALGDEYDSEAAPELIERGLAFNEPVLLRYPDRRLEQGNEVRLTATAVELLAVDLKASVLPSDPWRQH